MIILLGRIMEGSLNMQGNQRILIIEDEKNLSRFVELELQHEGYETKV